MDVVDDTLQLSGKTWEYIDLQTRYSEERGIYCTLNLDDQNVYKEIYQSGRRTLGVFQMEKETARDMFRRMKADNIHDVFAVNAMNRPAILSVGMHNTYIKNKIDPSGATYVHPDLEDIFGTTNAIMLYQEQALKTFGLAGFPDDETDNARRAIGKKKPEVMAKLYKKFHDGLIGRGWSESQIKEVWDLIDAQSTYSFNQGHSTAYGLLSYVTAYLKYYHPAEFMTALLISEAGDYSQTTKYIDEARQMGIEVLPPDINVSDIRFTVKGDSILFGFESIKGVGESTAQTIIGERSNRLYDSLKDLTDRIRLDAGTMVSLIKSGSFGMNKDELLLEFSDIRNVPDPLSPFSPVKTLKTKGEMIELGIITEEDDFKNKHLMLQKLNEYRYKKYVRDAEEREIKYKDKAREEFKKKYMQNPEMYEYETISIFLSGSPFDATKHLLKPFTEYNHGDIVLIAGTFSDVERKKSRKGGMYANVDLLTLTDGVLEGKVWGSQLSAYGDIVAKGKNVMISGRKEGENTFIANEIFLYDDYRKAEEVFISTTKSVMDTISELQIGESANVFDLYSIKREGENQFVSIKDGGEYPYSGNLSETYVAISRDYIDSVA